MRIQNTKTIKKISMKKATKKKVAKKHDPVNNPSHYTDGNIEVIDFIEDKKFNFNLGNSVKYIARAGKKNPDTLVQDLEKAQWYLSREINNLKKMK